MAPRMLATNPTAKAMCSASMKGAMSRPWAPTCVPEKIASITDGSTTLATSPIESAMLMTNPVWVSIIRAPDPIPRLSGGTALMTALVFGEMNSPDPAPMISCQSASCQYGVSTWIVVSPSRPTEVTSIPAVASTRDPNRSARAPLIGDRTRRPMASGPSMSPAVTGIDAAGALQVEDQQEQDAVPGHAVEQPGQVAHREHPVAEQAEVEERGRRGATRPRGTAARRR